MYMDRIYPWVGLYWVGTSIFVTEIDHVCQQTKWKQSSYSEGGAKWDEDPQVTDANLMSALCSVLCRIFVLIFTSIRNTNRHFEIINAHCSATELPSAWVGLGRVVFIPKFVDQVGSLLILFFLFLLGRPLQKKPKAPSFQTRSGWNLARFFFK